MKTRRSDPLPFQARGFPVDRANMNPLGQYDLEMRALIDLVLAGPGLVRELFYPGGFAIFASKVIKLRTANFPPSLHLNTFDVW